MTMPDTPILLVYAAAPGMIALTLGLLMLRNGRARALGATLVAMGLSLGALQLMVMIAYGVFPSSGLADSPWLLLGPPLGVYVAVLGVLLRRAGTSMPVSVLCAVAGTAALHTLAGFVLMQSACGVHSGGC